MICLECSRKVKMINCAHLKFCSGITVKKYKELHLGTAMRDDDVRILCGRMTESKRENIRQAIINNPKEMKRAQQLGLSNRGRKHYDRKSPPPMSEKTRNLCRIAAFEYLKKRLGKTAFEKRNKGEYSSLEKWFYDNVIIKHDLNKKFRIVYELPVFPYFIDFAFVDIKLAVELDGQWHFKNNTRVERDFKRDKTLIEKGWKMYRIKYDENNKIKVSRFMKYLNKVSQGIELPFITVTYNGYKLVNELGRKNHKSKVLINGHRKIRRNK